MHIVTAPHTAQALLVPVKCCKYPVTASGCMLVGLRHVLIYVLLLCAAGSGAAYLQPLLAFLHQEPFGTSR